MHIDLLERRMQAVGGLLPPNVMVNRKKQHTRCCLKMDAFTVQSQLTSSTCDRCKRYLLFALPIRQMCGLPFHFFPFKKDIIRRDIRRDLMTQDYN